MLRITDPHRPISEDIMLRVRQLANNELSTETHMMEILLRLGLVVFEAKRKDNTNAYVLGRNLDTIWRSAGISLADSPGVTMSKTPTEHFVNWLNDASRFGKEDSQTGLDND